MATRSRRIAGSQAPSIGDLSPMLLDERKAAPEIKYDGYRILAEFGGGALHPEDQERRRLHKMAVTWLFEHALGLKLEGVVAS